MQVLSNKMAEIFILDAKSGGAAKVLLDELTKGCTTRDLLYIDCKYYTASIKINLAKSAPNKFAKNVEAIIVCFDARSTESWETAKIYLERSDEQPIPVRLILCESLPDETLRSQVFQEAIDHHFEVVELSPNPEYIEEGDEYGLRRINSALVAHQWSNLTPKGSGVLDTKVGCQTSEPVESKAANSQSNGIESGSDQDGDLAEVIFNELFPKLMEMRSKTAKMGFEERRKVAEHITVKFWKALKLDEEEIKGLSDDESA